MTHNWSTSWYKSRAANANANQHQHSFSFNKAHEIFNMPRYWDCCKCDTSCTQPYVESLWQMRTWCSVISAIGGLQVSIDRYILLLLMLQVSWLLMLFIVVTRLLFTRILDMSSDSICALRVGMKSVNLVLLQKLTICSDAIWHPSASLVDEFGIGDDDGNDGRRRSSTAPVPRSGLFLG